MKYFVIILLFLLLGCSDSHTDIIIENIKRGENKITVLSKLGEPDKIEPCPENLWWNGKFLGKDDNQTCKIYFIYEGSFLKRWGIGFDKDDKVITKYNYVSE